MQIPAIIIQGDTATWRDKQTTDNLGNQIDSTWTLTWYFSGPTTLSVVSSAYDTGWQTTLTAAQTATLTPANPAREPNYIWQAKASKAGQVFTIGAGKLRVDASLSGVAAGFEGRTQAEIDLAAVQAAIRARVSGGAIAEYWIGQRKLRNEPLAELLKLETRLKAIVARERRRASMLNGTGDPKVKFARFT